MVRKGIAKEIPYSLVPLTKRENRWARVLFFSLAGIFALIGLDIFIFGSGFTNEPLEYIAAGVCLLGAVAIIGMAVLGALRTKPNR